MNYLPDFRCVNRPIPVLVSSGNCNASCMPKSENVVKCCQEASRSAMVTTCGRPLWPLLRYLFSLVFLVLMVSLTPAVDNIYIVSTQWFTFKFCYVIVIRVNQVCVCVCVIFVTFLEHFRLSEGLELWLIDWSNHLGKVRREKGLAKLESIVLWQTWRMRNMFSRRLCRGSLCNLLINHTQRCLPTHTHTLTHSLCTWVGAHTFLCVSPQHESANRQANRKKRHDKTTNE